MASPCQNWYGLLRFLECLVWQISYDNRERRLALVTAGPNEQAIVNAKAMTCQSARAHSLAYQKMADQKPAAYSIQAAC